MRHRRPLEERVGTSVTVILAVAAFAGSTMHILEVADTYGQGGLIALVIVAGGDLLALTAGMAIRTRRRAGYRYWSMTVAMPVLGLSAAGALTLAANLATADPSPWGYVLAVWPAVTFLLAVGILETRPSETRRRESRPSETRRRESRPKSQSPTPVPISAPSQLARTGAHHKTCNRLWDELRREPTPAQLQEAGVPRSSAYRVLDQVRRQRRTDTETGGQLVTLNGRQ